MARTRLLIATTNPNKIAEIREILDGMPVELATLADVPPVEQPEETGATFAENACLKATRYARATGCLAVAEDSGLEIDALGGEPGVQSARFLGEDATYPQRFEEIFRRLRALGLETSPARFVCALAVARGGTVLFETRGTIEGCIADRPAGTGGFGYDPIFYYPPYRQTLAEVPSSAKLTVAHRGHAFRAFAQWLRDAHLV